MKLGCVVYIYVVNEICRRVPTGPGLDAPIKSQRNLYFAPFFMLVLFNLEKPERCMVLLVILGATRSCEMTR